MPEGEVTNVTRNVISVLVDNEAGVLSRVAGLFSRRGYNIDSLSVGETHDSKLSRMTIVVQGDDAILEQIKKQLNKLVDVVKVVTLIPGNAVYRELVLMKVKANADQRAEISGIVDIFRAKIIDVAPTSVMIEITGDEPKINAFIDLMHPYGVQELVRTGLTALQRGDQNINTDKTRR